MDLSAVDEEPLPVDFEGIFIPCYLWKVQPYGQVSFDNRLKATHNILQDFLLSGQFKATPLGICKNRGCA